MTEKLKKLTTIKVTTVTCERTSYSYKPLATRDLPKQCFFVFVLLCFLFVFFVWVVLVVVLVLLEVVLVLVEVVASHYFYYD